MTVRALVISGGATKGAYICGCLQYLMKEMKLQYDVYIGTSVGAINSAWLAMFGNGKEDEAISSLIEWWQNLNNSKIYRHWPLWGRLAALWRNSFYDTSSLHTLIRENVDLKRIRDSGKKVMVGALNIHKGSYETFTQDSDDFIEAVLASSSFPAFFPPIKIQNDLFIDGGIGRLANIKSAIEDYGADEIDVITTAPEIRDKKFIAKPNIVDIIRRVLDVATDRILSNDIELAEMYNKLAEAGLSNKKPVKLRIFKPHYNLVDNVLDFDPVKIREMMEKGYEDARRIIEHITEE